MVRVQPGELTFAALLAGFAAFELWNHETGPWPLAAALAPDLAAGRARRLTHSSAGPFALGIAGFWAPHGHRLQVAALAWAAHVHLHRALGYDARD